MQHMSLHHISKTRLSLVSKCDETSTKDIKQEQIKYFIPYTFM